MKTQNSLILVLLLTSCWCPVPSAAILNTKASVPLAFHLQNLRLITSSINKKRQTMSTLYGNAIAVNQARWGGPAMKNEELVLVTWRQKADGNWFGAKIPNEPLSVEQVTTANDPLKPTYRVYNGKSLEMSKDTNGENHRIIYIFERKSSILP